MMQYKGTGLRYTQFVFFLECQKKWEVVSVCVCDFKKC